MTHRWCPVDGWFRTSNGDTCPDCGRMGEPAEDAPVDPPREQ